MMKYNYRSNKGSALPAVLLILLIVTALSGAAVSLATTQTKEERYYENNISALHTAEAGLHQYLWYLNKENSRPIDFDIPVNYPEGNAVAAFQLTRILDDENQKQIQAKGWMLNDPGVTRTVTATFHKRSFTQYIYFSDEDPDGIWWTSYDNCYGPYHTNTKLSSKGHPNFWGKATSVGGIVYYTNRNNDYPTFHKGYQQLRNTIDMPSNNSELMSYGKNKGYYYEGRTSIRLNSNGTITVWNPNITPSKATLPLPENGVIYVNEKRGTNYSDKFDPDNGNVFISGVMNGRLTVAAKHDIYITGYDPTEASLSGAGITNGIRYKDTTFSLNTSTGVVTYNETAGEGEGDILGLIADVNVAVLTKGWFNGANLDSSRKNFDIHAAVLAINGSFINSVHMNNASPSVSSPGSAGTLTVRGAIIQNKRGAVGYFNSNTGMTSSGYTKNYAHDPRMEFDQPPHFLAPEGSGWEITAWDEIN